MKNGMLNSAGDERKKPLKAGDSDEPTERAMLVIPAAAERSSGLTTAIGKDWRVGTSIWEMEYRSIITAIARLRFGMSGIRQSNILEGICVNTIVLMRPILDARRTASKAEMPARIFAPKKIPPSVPASTPNLT